MKAKSHPILIVFFAILLPLHSFGSSFLNPDPIPKKGRFSVGPVLSYNISAIQIGNGGRLFREINLNKSKTIGGGILFNFQVTNNVFVQSGIIYDNRTANGIQKIPVLSSRDPSENIIDVQFSYINVPLVVGYEFPLKGFNPYLAGGLSFGWGIKQNVEYTCEEFATVCEPASASYDKSEYGIIGKIGVRKHLANFAILSIGAQYTGSERTIRASRPQIQIINGAANLGTRKLSFVLSCVFKL